jgi:hypothetical protein
MELKSSAFCSLSRSADWQVFLKDIAPDLHKDLKRTLSSSKGCRANSNKMMDIYHEINKRGLEKDLEVFLKRRFPWIIKQKHQPTRKAVKKQVMKAQVTRAKNPTVRNWKTLNKHNVFKIYRPDMLSFPQKLILVGNAETLYDNVQNFVKDKLAVDYVIIEDRAYIEYFEAKYASVVDKIPRNKRDIFQYRKKMQQDA